MMEMFLGKSVEFWVEIKRATDVANTTHLFSEIATLRAKVSYYESKIQELSEFMKIKLEVKL